MLHPREYFPLRCAIAFQLVGDDHPWHVGQALQQLAEKFLRRFLVAAALHQHIEPVPVLIHRPPQVMPFAVAGQKHLVPVPRVARPGPAASELMGIRLSERAAPLPDRLGGDEDAAGEQQIFDVPVAEAEAEVEPDAVANDLGRKPLVCVWVGW